MKTHLCVPWASAQYGRDPRGAKTEWRTKERVQPSPERLSCFYSFQRHEEISRATLRTSLATKSKRPFSVSAVWCCVSGPNKVGFSRQWPKKKKLNTLTTKLNGKESEPNLQWCWNDGWIFFKQRKPNICWFQYKIFSLHLYKTDKSNKCTYLKSWNHQVLGIFFIKLPRPSTF